MTNPTGGATFSWASLGDLILAEPGSTISLLDLRVIKDTVREELPTGFQARIFIRS